MYKRQIDGCVMINDRFAQHGWLQYSLPLDTLGKLDYTRGYEKGMHAFYRFVFTVKKIGDTLDVYKRQVPSD